MSAINCTQIFQVWDTLKLDFSLIKFATRKLPVRNPPQNGFLSKLSGNATDECRRVALVRHRQPHPAIASASTAPGTGFDLCQRQAQGTVARLQLRAGQIS
jgi:hypothetical protein